MSSGKGPNKFVVKLALSPNGGKSAASLVCTVDSTSTSQIFVLEGIDLSACSLVFFALVAGPFRRVGFGNFVGSHKKLCSAAAELAAADSDEMRVIQYKMRVTYRDEDGDSCLLLNDNDVKMAVLESDKPLKVFAEILELSSVKANPTVASPTVATREAEVPVQTHTEPDPVSPNNNDHHPPALHQAVESVVGVLANAVIGLHQASAPNQTASSNETAAETTSDENSRSVPEETNEVEESTGDEEKEERKFIHGRHTCDSCLTTPIVRLLIRELTLSLDIGRRTLTSSILISCRLESDFML